MSPAFDVANARSQFPALSGAPKQVFFDNAGGSQVLASVIRSIQQYLGETNVQLGASYGVSRASSSLYEKGYGAAAAYMNAGVDEIVIGSSTTQVFRNLSFALRFDEGDEIVLSKVDHETNIDAWTGMAQRQKLVVKWWAPADATNPKLEPGDLDGLLSEKTRFVACTHASNVLGTIHDVKAIAQKVHTIPGALFCVDGVAYAPHRQIDVKALEVDFYAFSWYKVYGPHVSQLYARREIKDRLLTLGHYFNPQDSLSSKIGVAGSNYEATQSIPSIVAYLGSNPTETWKGIAEHEEKLASILLDFLNSQDNVTIFGQRTPNSAVRVPTISFAVKGKAAKSVIEEVEQRSNFGCRWGHFYSKRLVDEILQMGDEGVVRVSMVHYNTEDEVRGLVGVLRDITGQ